MKRRNRSPGCSTSSEPVWLVALPVSVIVIWVALSRVNTAVRPAGMPLRHYVAARPPRLLVKVSPHSVITTLPETEPSLAAVSAKPPV